MRRGGDRHRAPGARPRAACSRARPLVVDFRGVTRGHRGAEPGAPVSDVRVGSASSGLGYWGPNLARNFDALAGRRAALDLRRLGRGARALGAPFPRRPRRSRPRRAARRRLELDAVVVATPVPTHAAARRCGCSEAGKHCFVEKPLAQSVADAERGGRRRASLRAGADGRPPARVPPRRREAQGDRRRPASSATSTTSTATGSTSASCAPTRTRSGASAPTTSRWCCGSRGRSRPTCAQSASATCATGVEDVVFCYPALPLRARRAPAPLVARPAQGAALHGRRLEADGDLRRHGGRAQADGVRQGFRPGLRLLRRVHRALRRHLEPALCRTRSRCGSSAATSSTASRSGQTPRSDGGKRAACRAGARGATALARAGCLMRTD